MLLLASLSIPVLHHCLTNEAIEHTRGFTGFLPAEFLFLRWFGQISWALPFFHSLCFVFSLFHEEFTRAKMLFGLAAMQLLFMTFYGTYSAFILSLVIKARAVP